MKKIVKAIALLLCVCCLSFAVACGDVGSSNGSDKGNIPSQSTGEDGSNEDGSGEESGENNSGESSGENSNETSGESGNENSSEENPGESSGESGSNKEDSGVWTPPAKM